MDFILSKYNLPDLQLLEEIEDAIQTWIPDRTYVILGQRDTIESAINIESVEKDNVSIMQRPSGGHSVVLTPNTVVVSILSTQSELSKIKKFFSDCNTVIIKALEEQGVLGLSIRGVSDIVLNGRKIVGSSMYKGKDFLFFHAVINISESVEIISKYLKHPETEPEYRKGRKHFEFITSLAAENYKIDVKRFKKHLKG